MKPGQTYQLRMTKKNVGANVQLNTYVNGRPHCSALDTAARFLKRQGDVVKAAFSNSKEVLRKNVTALEHTGFFGYVKAFTVPRLEDVAFDVSAS